MQRSSSSAFGIRLAVILAAGLSIRLALAAAVPTRPVSDFWEYMRSAQSLARTGRYEAAPGVPNGNHPPAYPIVLSLGLRLAPSASDLFTAKAVNAALAALAAFVGALLARRFWGQPAGLWTAAWLAFLPRSLLMSDLIASENLFSPLWMLFLLLAAISWTGSRSPGLAAAIGAVVGLLALTRSVAYFLPLVWLAGALAARRPIRALAAGLVLMVAAEHAVMLPWAIRNERALGRFTFLNDVGGQGLFMGNNDHATGNWYPWRGDLERLRPGVSKGGEFAVDDAARQEAVRWIRANPGRALRLYSHKLRIVMTDDEFPAVFTVFGEAISPPYPPAAVLPGPHGLKDHRVAMRRILRFSGLLLALCALLGFLSLLRGAGPSSETDRVLAAGLLAAALYVPLVSSAIAVNGRYRWPAEEAIAPLAGLFLARPGWSHDSSHPRTN